MSDPEVNRQVGDAVMAGLYEDLRAHNPYLPPPDAVTRHSGMNLRVAPDEVVTLTIEVFVAIPPSWYTPPTKEIPDVEPAPKAVPVCPVCHGLENQCAHCLRGF